MNSSILVEAIAGSVAVTVAALSYLFTKRKEREADWRKWKYEQYKEFIGSLGEMVAGGSTPEHQQVFVKHWNVLNLIGSPGVLNSLQAWAGAINANKTSSEQNILFSRVIWEIREDLGIPGTPEVETFFAQLWRPVPAPMFEGMRQSIR